MARRPSQVFLQPWQSPVFQVLAGLFLFVALGGFFITNLFEFTVFYQFLVLFHTVLGMLLLLPFIYYMVGHGYIQYRMSPLRTPKLTGLLVSVTMSIALASGLGLVLYSARSEFKWLVYTHMWSSVAGVLALAVHLVQGWVVDPLSRRFKTVRVLPRVAVAAAVPVGFVVISAQWYTHEPYYQELPQGYQLTRGEFGGPFFPSEAKTVTGDMITLAAVANSQSCGTAGCHVDIVKQWEQSLHRLSFHEPIYRANELDIIEERGMPTSRWCASCHEPVVLMSGNMDVGGGLDPKTLTGHPYDGQFNEGISCVACHGITRNDSLKGVGSYVFGAPDYYIFTAREEPVLREINELIIRVKPQPHRETFLQPVLKDSRSCVSCHKVFLDENLNHYRWVAGQNQFDSWRTGPWSNENFLTFRTQPLRRCVDCHMAPEAVSNDVAANSGTVANHAFAGANAVIPTFFGNTEQLRRVLENKKNRLRIRIAEVQAAADPEFNFHTRRYVDQPIRFSEVSAKAGQTLNVSVSVTNTGIGHRFPTGTNDAKDVWLEFVAADSTGREVFHSGYVDADLTIDPDAHFYRVIPIDKDAEWINTRRMWTIRTLAYARTIPPGAADLTVYRFTVPPDARGPLTLTARVRYRKVSKPFMERVARLDPRIYEQPIIDMGEDSLVVGMDGVPGSVRPEPDVRAMLIDYGIGLFREGNFEFARRAFLTALELDKADPRVYTNVAMTFFRESEYATALDWLARSEAVEPTDSRVPWFQALIAQRAGRYEEALALLDRVVAKWPMSDLAWFEIGKMRGWVGDTAGAYAAYQKVIEIDPNHAGAYHGLAQVYRQEGRDLEAQAMMAAFQRLRQDTQVGPLLNRFYERQPWIATTTRPGYIHDRGRTAGAPTSETHSVG